MYSLTASTIIYDTTGSPSRTVQPEDIDVIKFIPRNKLSKTVSPSANAEALAASNFNGVGVTPLTTAAVSFDSAAASSEVSISWTGSIAWTSAKGTDNPVVLTHELQNEDLTKEVYEVRGHFKDGVTLNATSGTFVVTSVTGNIADDTLGSVAWEMLKVEDDPIFKNDL